MKIAEELGHAASQRRSNIYTHVGHQALAIKVPADLYRFSLRPYGGLEELEYPFHDWSVVVTHCGRICFKGGKINLSHVFAGQKVGVKQKAGKPSRT